MKSNLDESIPTLEGKCLACGSKIAYHPPALDEHEALLCVPCAETITGPVRGAAYARIRKETP